jgi:hypothetical protein
VSAGAVRLGWPFFLFGQAWVIPVAACLAAAALGRPGLAWLRRLARRELPRGNRLVAAGSTWAYDFLRRVGRTDEAEAWLRDLEPDLHAGGARALGGAYAELLQLGYGDVANDRLGAALSALADEELPAVTANALAWGQLGRGDPALSAGA